MRLTGIAAGFLLALAGCGGSGLNGPPTGHEPPPEGPDPVHRNTTVTVTARDAFGEAVPGASILLLYSSGTGFLETRVRTDAEGSATIDRAPDNTYAVALDAEALFGTDYEATPTFLNQIHFDVTLHPWSPVSPGISRVKVTEVSADARQLTFTARLYLIQTYAEEQGWHWGEIEVQPCDDCIEGPGGFTAAYTGLKWTNELIEPVPVPDALSIALLLDQGERVSVKDAVDKRLLAAKYLPTRLSAGDTMALAAFADDDIGTGQPALLPDTPVTIFPVQNPAFTSEGRAYFETIDSLATLEGGESPFYAAIGEMLDFTASAAPPDSRSAVVVVTGSGAGDCGDPAECAIARDAALAKSTSTGIAVVAVELADAAGDFDRHGLGPIAQAELGTIFWAEDASQVPVILGRVPEVLDGRHAAIDVKFRLESPAAGAFASGNFVDGAMRVIVCPWDCSVLVTVPFALRVP